MIEWRNLKKLHQGARTTIENQQDTIRTLKEENERLAKRTEDAEAALKDKDETIQQLEKLLFERKQDRSRMVRPHPVKERAPESYRRPVPARIDERKAATLTTCPDCHTPVSAAQGSRTRRIEDIVLNPKTVITEWTVTRHWCTSCKRQVEASIPGIAPHASLGPNVLTILTFAKYRLNLPYNKIRDLFGIGFGLSISDGEIAHLLARARDYAIAKHDLIAEAVKHAPCVHCDETGWPVSGERAWAHVFSMPDEVLYVIHETRGKGVAERALGPGFLGSRISDCLANYLNLLGWHQICWAHFTREAFDNYARDGTRERGRLYKILEAIYARLRKETADWDIDRAMRVLAWCETQVSTLFAQTWRDARSRRIVERLRTFRDALFTCLLFPGIAPDNNEAERALRAFATQRKISGGNRSWAHALIHAQLMSVIETLRKEGGDLLANLQRLFNAGLQEQLARQ